MWAIPTGISSVLKKKKNENQVVSPSPESRVPKTGSDPPIGSDRDSGRDIHTLVGVRGTSFSFRVLYKHFQQHR